MMMTHIEVENKIKSNNRTADRNNVKEPDILFKFS